MKGTQKLSEARFIDWLRALLVENDITINKFDTDRPRILVLSHGRQFRIKVVDEHRPHKRMITWGKGEQFIKKYDTQRFFYVTQISRKENK